MGQPLAAYFSFCRVPSQCEPSASECVSSAPGGIAAGWRVQGGPSHKATEASDRQVVKLGMVLHAEKRAPHAASPTADDYGACRFTIPEITRALSVPATKMVCELTM